MMKLIKQEEGKLRDYTCTFEVAPEALQEKLDNWYELHGLGTGYADVIHQDWKDIARFFNLKKAGEYALLTCYLADGTLALCGSLTKWHNRLEITA